MTLYVVYVPETGHVVGALNATGAPAPPDVGALVGAALPMRISVGGDVTTLPLRANLLALHKADDEPGVFADPMAFGVEQVSGADPKPTLVELLSAEELELTFTTNSLVVTVPVPNASQDSAVLALISDGQDTHVRLGEIPAEGDSVELPVTVPNGTHGVLVLVAGWAGVLTTETRSS
jgi:hypothetical protein